MPRPFTLSRLLVLTVGLGLAGPVAADDDDLRSQRATRKVLKEQAAQQELSEAARDLARARRHEAMRMLKRLLRDAQGERKAEMMLRLAEYYQAEADDLQHQAWRGWEACMERDEEPCGNEPDLDGSLAWRDKALRLYEQVVRHYPMFARADEAAWGQAIVLLELGRPDEALDALTWLVRARPESAHVPAAYVLIGDHWFERDRALPALNAYRRSSAFVDADIRPYALYKQAWCLFNLGEYDQAIDVMKVVALQRGDEAGAVGLQDEALRDLARFFADAGDLDGAIRFYEGLGRPDLLRSAMKRVASFVEEQGNPERAVFVLAMMLTKFPHDAAAPAWQADVVRLRHGMNSGAKTLAALEVLVRDFGPESAWARANAGDVDAMDERDAKVEATLRTLAIDWHQRVRKLRTGPEAEAAAGQALAAYQVWLDRHEERAEAHELRYAYAELLYQVGRHDRAWDQYMEVVRRHPTGKRSRFCAESAVYVADEIAGKVPRDADAPPGVEPVALSPWDERLVEAVDSFVELFPGEDRTRAFATKAAWMLYHRNHFAQAADRFQVVIAMDPGSEEAEVAVTLILDSLNLVGDWDKLAEVAEAFLHQEGLGRPGFDAHLREVWERATFKGIEAALEEGGDRATAAAAFEAFSQRFRESEIADLALHNAAVHYRAGDDLPGALRVGEALVEAHPDSEHFTEALASLGYDCESVADFERAANWYERLVHHDEEHPGAADALWSAALFRIALGQDEAALRDLLGHASRWPEHPRQAELLATVAEVHESAGRHAEAGHAWASVLRLDQGLVEDDQRAHASIRRARALVAQERRADALELWAEVAQSWGSLALEEDASVLLRDSVGEALYHLGEAPVARYEAIDISGREAPTGRRAAQAWSRQQTQAKAAALLEVEEAQATVIEAGAGGWGLAALVRLGGAYEHMADAVRGAWVPPWLTPEQAALYRIGLDDQAWVLEEKAVGAYRHAVERSRELAVYGAELDDARQRLTTLRPDEHPPVEEQLLPPVWLSGE